MRRELKNINYPVSTFNYITSQLATFYSPQEARDLAFWILEETTGLSRADISAGKDTQNISNIEIILKRLQKKEPIQYIFGHTLWFGLDLLVNSATLIPRPETAELVEWILQTMPADKPLSVLDIGTGSGCIAIALKQRRPNWQVTGLDISSEALQIAQQNAIRNKTQVTWLQQDIFSDFLSLRNDYFTGTFDLIVSNPPYVLNSEKCWMESTVLDYEPHSALFVPDDDPLRFYKRICSMKSGKSIFFEVNERFAEQVAQLLRDSNYSNVQIKSDIYGKQRMVCARA